ncbi:MAG: cyclic nucleotide-binding domain-containing protein [Spirochaetota bacterium]
MTPQPNSNDGCITLPRGGYLVDTSVGYIQFGSPPETIKDTMKMEKSTPLTFVVPNKFFHIDKGISTAELEFPLYFNFFLRQKRTKIVCTEKQVEQLKVVLEESVFGPKNINLENEFIYGKDTYGFPDMRAEIDHFAGMKQMEDLVEFVTFQDNEVTIDETIKIKKNPGGDFVVVEGDKETAVPGEVGFNIKYDIGVRLKEPFQAPLLGITCLGPSHGFDPNDNTSGFIVWLNHKGVMVDPPVNSTEWLRESNVNPKLINHVILTHCHADHDAGTFQKILEESKITIHATPTVFESFLRKYCTLTEIPKEEIVKLFHFQPIIIGKPVYINGARFNFFYSLHSIPAVGFEFFIQDQSFIYSSDHKNDPETFDDLYAKGVLTESRYEFLKNFPWHRDIIYHEAGVPPLHTKISYLSSLPEEVQKKITVYHISKGDMPENSNMTLAKFGIENTLYPKITPPKHIGAYNLLDILSQMDIFSGFTVDKAKEFLSIVNEEQYKRGDQIIKKGTPGDKFYIIASGNVSFKGLAHQKSGTPTKRFGTYEYFGEASVIMDIPRQSDVFAETEVIALTIEKNKFLQFIHGTDMVSDLRKLNVIRDTNSWQTFSNSKHFNSLTSYQLTQLELLLEMETIPTGEFLIRENETFEKVYIIREGIVGVYKNHYKKLELDSNDIEEIKNYFQYIQDNPTLSKVDEMGAGDFIGEVYKISNGIPSGYSFKAHTDLQVYSITKDKLIEYIKKNPGVYMRMKTIYA